MSTRWVTQQILLIRTEPRRVVSPNPRPMGFAVPGSATDAVLKFLAGQPSRGWWAMHQVVAATGRTDKAVGWALIYLRSVGLVECARDEARNARYLRYRAKQ